MTQSVCATVDRQPDRGSGFLQPDTILPQQLCQSLRGQTAQGELRLILAILEDGVLCYRKYAFARDNRGRRLFREAEQWIGGDGPEWFLSFENICATLDLDPRYVREGLYRWRGQELAARDVDPVWSAPQAAPELHRSNKRPPAALLRERIRGDNVAPRFAAL